MSQNFKNFAELWWKDNFCEIFVCISTQWLSIQSLWLNCFLSFKPKFCFSTDTPSYICPLPKIAFLFWRNSILDIFWTKIMTGEDLYKSLIFWIFNFDIRLWYKCDTSLIQLLTFVCSSCLAWPSTASAGLPGGRGPTIS